jgi:hypothetical protein
MAEGEQKFRNAFAFAQATKENDQRRFAGTNIVHAGIGDAIVSDYEAALIYAQKCREYHAIPLAQRYDAISTLKHSAYERLLTR